MVRDPPYCSIGTVNPSAVAVIGPGHLGLSLASSLEAAGWCCVRLRARDSAAADTARRRLPEIPVDDWSHPTPEPWPSVIVICVSDPTITVVANDLAGELESGSIVLHTSGRLPAAVLDPCRRRGAGVASWHPLQTFAGLPVPPGHWTGVPCAVEGDSIAVTRGSELAVSLGAVPWQIDPTHKARYHAAAAVAGNLTHILVAAARDMMADVGLPDAEMLWPLVRSSSRGALDTTGLDGLTGAIARRDRGAVLDHVAALPEPFGAIYRRLASACWDDAASTWLD